MDLSEQSILSEVAKNDPNADIRRKAVKKLTDQTAIGEVAKNDVKTDIRIMALKKLKNQTAIAEVAKNDHKTDVRMRALKKLTDIPALFEIAKSDPKTDIRRMALKKIKKLTGKNKGSHTAGIDVGDNSDNIENIKIIENETDIFERISSFISEIDLFNNYINNVNNDNENDKIISNETAAIKDILVKMTAFLKEENDNERRLRQFDDFSDYYFPTVIKILDSYRQITEHKLDGGNAIETKKRIIEAMPVIKKAFEKELDNMYENKMLDITTDIDVLEAILAKDGILYKN